MFLVSLRYSDSPQRIDELLPAHTIWLDGHYASGAFLMSGRQVPRTGGVILARAGSKEKPARISTQDPFVRAGAAVHKTVERSKFGETGHLRPGRCPVTPSLGACRFLVRAWTLALVGLATGGVPVLADAASAGRRLPQCRRTAT